MAKLQTVATTTTTVKIAPNLRRRLLSELRAYADLKAQIDALKEAADNHKEACRTIREEIGEESLALEGFKLKNVVGTHVVLNEQKLIALGCAAAWLQEAKESRPKKAYELISVPGVDDER